MIFHTNFKQNHVTTFVSSVNLFRNNQNDGRPYADRILLRSIGQFPSKFPLPISSNTVAASGGVPTDEEEQQDGGSILSAPISRLSALGARVALRAAHAGLRVVVHRFLRYFIVEGCLKVREPSGDTLIFGDASSSSRALIIVRRDDFYRRIALRADLGLSEAYM